MIKIEKIALGIFMSLIIIFYIIPVDYQKIFRILLGVFFLILFFSYKIKNFINMNVIALITILLMLGVVQVYRGFFMSSYINIILNTLGILVLSRIDIKFTESGLKKMDILYNISLLFLVGYFVYFTFFESGNEFNARPSIGYETNKGGVYLLMFFFLSDLLNKSVGKLVVVIMSILLLSRLLIFSIIIFYTIRWIKHLNIFKKLMKIKPSYIMIFVFVSVSYFSYWYTKNINYTVNYDVSVARIVELNDKSNDIRFKINEGVLSSMKILDANTFLGFGNIVDDNNKIISNDYKLRVHEKLKPHNTVFFEIIYYGIIFSLVSFVVCSSIYNKIINIYNIEIFYTILFSTMFLHFTFLWFPSFETIFIMFLLRLNTSKYEKRRNRFCNTLG